MTTKTVDFSKYSSIKIGPVAEVFIIDENTKLDEDVFIIYYTDVPKKIETYEEYKSYTENEAHLLKGYFIDGEVRFITKCQQIRKLDIF